MFETIGNFFSKYFKQPKSIILAIILAIGLCIYVILKIHNIYATVISILLIICVLIYYIIDTVKYNSIPVASESSETSVLIRIFAKTKEEYEDIKFKLAEEFKKFLNNNEKNEVIYIPYHLIDKYQFNDKENIINLLKKTNCIFLATIRTKSEDLKDDTQYITEINLGLIHPEYEEKIEEFFEKEFSLLGSSTNRLEYTKKDKMTILETTAKRLSYLCQYILGRAYFFNGNFKKSSEICDRLYNILCNENSQQKTENNLKRVTTLLCYDIHMGLSRIENSKENGNLDKVEEELKKANKFVKNTYAYNLCMASCVFLKNRDITKAKKYLNLCKQKEKQGIGRGEWKYSIAFLSAYEGESEGKVVYKYMQALKKEYHNVGELIYFIEDICEKEEKNMLRFALFILYIEIKEYEVAKKLLKEYLKNENKDNLEKGTINKLKSKYGSEIIKKICDE
jgi:hypothetical protein